MKRNYCAGKSLLCVVLSVLMILSLVPITASAEVTQLTKDSQGLLPYIIS